MGGKSKDSFDIIKLDLLKKQKQELENDIFCFEIQSGFGQAGSTSNPKNPTNFPAQRIWLTWFLRVLPGFDRVKK